VVFSAGYGLPLLVMGVAVFATAFVWRFRGRPRLVARSLAVILVAGLVLIAVLIVTAPQIYFGSPGVLPL
jgi:hypothetical protein